MKIQIRKNVFETNSSSSHSLIITNTKNLNNDIEIVKKKEKHLYPEYLNFDCRITSKEEKVLMLGGLFDFEMKINDNLKEEYQVFLQVLKDNNEEELLKKLKENYLKFQGDYDEPYCTNFFENGCLIECNCNFAKHFKDFFLKKRDIDDKRINKILNKEAIENMPEEFKKVIMENNQELYQKLKTFIYEDGIIIPYEF